jgi:Zn finger protein HypA/HybF involved in hydrogenase expression
MVAKVKLEKTKMKKAVYQCSKCGKFISRLTWIKFQECFQCWAKEVKIALQSVKYSKEK